MGGGTYYQTEYSLIMTNLLKQEYKLEGRGRNLGMEQKIRRVIHERKVRTQHWEQRTCSNFRRKALLFESLIG